MDSIRPEQKFGQRTPRTLPFRDCAAEMLPYQGFFVFSRALAGVASTPSHKGAVKSPFRSFSGTNEERAWPTWCRTKLSDFSQKQWFLYIVNEKFLPRLQIETGRHARHCLYAAL